MARRSRARSSSTSASRAFGEKPYFVLSQGGKKIELEKSDIQDWTIRFVDTGMHSNVGERLRRVRKHLDGEEMFLANYADCLSDINCETHVASFVRKDKVAAFVTVKVPHTFHIVHADDEGNALSLEHITESPIRLNGGFFILRTSIFDYMKEGEELVVEPFQALAQHGGLRGPALRLLQDPTPVRPVVRCAPRAGPQHSGDGAQQRTGEQHGEQRERRAQVDGGGVHVPTMPPGADSCGEEVPPSWSGRRRGRRRRA